MSKGQWGLRVTKVSEEISRLYSRSNVSFEEAIKKAQAVLEKQFPPAPEKVWWTYTYRGGYGYTDQIAALVLKRHTQKARVVVYEMRSKQLQHKNARLDLLAPRTDHSILDEKWTEAQTVCRESKEQFIGK